MLAGRLRNVFARRTILETVKPNAITQRLDEVGEGLVAEYGDEPDVKLAIGLQELKEITVIRGQFRGLGKMAQLFSLRGR